MRKSVAARGFTLIEVMIVVVIMGILAAVVIPSYQESVMKTRRAEGKAALTDLANRMERFYVDTGAYPTALGTGAGQLNVTTTTEKGWYILGIAARTNTTYVIKATPQNAQATKDTVCATYAMDQTGRKGELSGTTVSTTDAATCW